MDGEKLAMIVTLFKIKDLSEYIANSTVVSVMLQQQKICFKKE